MPRSWPDPAVVAALFFAAVAITIAVAIVPAPWPIDLRVTSALQAIPALDGPARLISALGDWRLQYGLVLGAMSLVALRGGREGGLTRGDRGALTVLALVLVFRLFDVLLKVATGSPRPDPAFGVEVDHVRESFGFPSAHVYSTVLIFGALAVCAPAYLRAGAVPWARAALVIPIVLIAPARIVLGAHWPLDTVGGYLWGAAMLGAAGVLASAGLGDRVAAFGSGLARGLGGGAQPGGAEE